MKRLIITAVLLAISIPASAERVRMWRDADGRVQFGDAPPSWSRARTVVTTPENRMGTYGSSSSSVVDEAERVREKWRNRQDAPAVQYGLTYDEERRIRELELEKKEVRRSMKNRRISVGEGIVREQEIRGINRQILEIERRR